MVKPRLFPAEVAPVCPGEQLIFVCSTNSTFILWNATLFGGQSIGIDTQVEFVTRGSAPTFLLLNGSLLNVTKTSNDSDEVLRSTLTIMNVSVNLNGTTINCTEVAMSEGSSANSSVAVIEVIAANEGKHFQFKILTLNQ